jgi:hypothetical protein
MIGMGNNGVWGTHGLRSGLGRAGISSPPAGDDGAVKVGGTALAGTGGTAGESRRVAAEVCA